MITASQCRRQAALYGSKAEAEPCIGIRQALLDLNRSWIAIAEPDRAAGDSARNQQPAALDHRIAA
jgi:hypothetical protein